jgi:hypothetical protein
MRSEFGNSVMDQTAPNSRNGTNLVQAITFTLLLGVGTGGDYTRGYHELRTAGLAFSKPRRDEETAALSGIAADIEHVRSTLKLTMRELSDCLDVSRQAPYNWIAGGQLKARNAAKLNNLKAAAHVIALANLPPSPLLLQRKLPGGRTLVDSIAAGADGTEAAEALVEMFRHEEVQRQMLAARFPRRIAAGTLPPANES